MRRIGTTNDGGTLIEFSAGEVTTIQSAMDLLGKIVGDAPAADPAQSAPKITAKPPRVCKHCGKPVDAKDGLQCRACMYRIYQKPDAKPKAAKGSSEQAFTPKPHTLSGRVTRETTAMRERDPKLDLPQQHGRTIPLVGQE